MTLSEAPLNQPLKVSPHFGEKDELSALESRLMHLGFIHEEPIMIRKKSKIFGSPLLVQVRGRQIALTKKEASLVPVYQVENHGL